MTIAATNLTAKQKTKIDWLKRMGAVEDPTVPFILKLKDKTYSVDTDGRIETLSTGGVS